MKCATSIFKFFPHTVGPTLLHENLLSAMVQNNQESKPKYRVRIAYSFACFALLTSLCLLYSLAPLRSFIYSLTNSFTHELVGK